MSRGKQCLLLALQKMKGATQKPKLVQDRNDENDGPPVTNDSPSVTHSDVQKVMAETHRNFDRNDENDGPPISNDSPSVTHSDVQKVMAQTHRNFERSSSNSSSSSSSSSSNSSSSSSSSDSSDDAEENKECSFCSDDSYNDKDYVLNYIDKTDSESEQSERVAEDQRWIFEGLRDDVEPDSEKEIELHAGNEEITAKSEFDSPKKAKKRKLNKDEWKRSNNKKRRNMGLSYETSGNNKKQKKAREIKPACKETCRMKCNTKISHEQRAHVFESYWKLGDINLQRQFLVNYMKEIQPMYRCVRQNRTRGPRGNNISYSLPIDGTLIRVCKTFFLNTLDITDRVTRTAMTKQNKVADVVLEEDKRGKHGNHPTTDPLIKNGVRSHIESIPKIESHYTSSRTARTYICGSRSLADIHRDYVKECKEQNKSYANYTMFHNIFTTEYNISFFSPKKDQCDDCVMFNNSEGEAKAKLKEKYDIHQTEKQLSRKEKEQDKTEGNAIVAVYDLEAVMQLPQGDVSTLYYKSKLNVLNLTVYDIKKNLCECFVWNETEGNRGVNIGTCILNYIQSLCEKNEGDNIEIIFYSDNCAGQQNKFMLALYLYAVTNLPVESITHKFLIKGHTQNEGDSAHSLIERQVKRLRKGGPIFVPETLVTAIRSAKKTGQPFTVREMQHYDFKNVKCLATQMGAINVKDLKLSDTKVLKFEKQSPTSVSIKYSYNDEFKTIEVIKKPKIVTDLLQCYSERIALGENKKKDLKELCEKGIIPRPYSNFYESILQ